MSTHEETALVGHVVGENFRRLREAHGLTQAEAAMRLRHTGLRWSRSHVAALEAGNRESVDAGVLLLLAAALEVSERELFAGDGAVRLAPEAVVTRAWLRDRYTEGPAEEPVEISGQAVRAFLRDMEPYLGFEAAATPFQADAELAQRLGLRPEDVYRAAERLWGRTLHQERDRRIAEMGEMPAAERRARRGHVTRQLAKELEPHLPKRRTRRRK
jgi:transcriptional regulator with XRE-family HTH domain